ncbi:glycoside hydrolase family 28 protein [Paenibacillus sp. y28]|uniref:glycoside hydrolase family 28 protein n=1 Tax=Paenibacillus sp. y28 TaxID=3129110 RepID=UPI00301ABE0B
MDKHQGFFNAVHYGAVGDGATKNTESFAKAIEAIQAAGGGTLFVPAGTYLTGAIHLVSNMTLHLDAGAKLLFVSDLDEYPTVKTRWSGYECYGYSPCIYGYELSNVAITGRGTIDGNGSWWWNGYFDCKKGERQQTERERGFAELNSKLYQEVKSNIVEWESQFLRPALVQLMHCDNVLLQGVTHQNSPFWNTHLVYCQNVTIHSVTFNSPENAPNTDGLDIDSCANVRVSDCHFHVGDDCIVIKSGIDEDGRRIGKPSENIAITNCTMLKGHGGVVLGSETAGGLRNIVISNCIFIGTERGIRMKSNRARGGIIEDIRVSNILMQEVLCPFTINMFYRYGVDPANEALASETPQPITECTPAFRNIYLSDITARGTRASAGFLYGLPEQPIEDVVLDNVTIEMTTNPDEQGGEPDMVRDVLNMAGEGMFAKYVKACEFRNVRIETRQGPALTLEAYEDVLLEGVRMRTVHPNTPVIDKR